MTKQMCICGRCHTPIEGQGITDGGEAIHRQCPHVIPVAESSFLYLLKRAGFDILYHLTRDWVSIGDLAHRHRMTAQEIHRLLRAFRNVFPLEECSIKPIGDRKRKHVRRVQIRLEGPRA